MGKKFGMAAGAIVLTVALALGGSGAAFAGGGKGYGGGPQKCNVWCFFPGQIAGCC